MGEYSVLEHLHRVYALDIDESALDIDESALDIDEKMRNILFALSADCSSALQAIV
jgi:hypothetical protein